LNYHNTLPQDLKLLVDLPGIGRSTAAAIMSLAYNQAEPIMDGNVKRVFARHFLVSGEPNKSSTLKQLWQLAEDHRELKNPAAYTQGLMDLGAKVCTKHNPNCNQCPVAVTCLAKAGNVIEQYPEKKRRVVQKEVNLYCLLIVKNNRVALMQRSDSGIWPNLWFLPTFETEQLLKTKHSDVKTQFSLTHKLTHRILQLHIYTASGREKLTNLEWVERALLGDKPHPKALIHILDQHDNHQLH
jgi:A/G-specific adenine glycosylase